MDVKLQRTHLQYFLILQTLSEEHECTADESGIGKDEEEQESFSTSEGTK